MRLICFPFAGGGTHTYRDWAKELGLEVVAAQLPGRERRGREAPLSSMEPLVADQLVHLATATAAGPYALFGHSLGSGIAFALTRELARRGRPGPRCLVVSGGIAPYLPRRLAPISALPDPAFIAELREYGGTPQAVLDEPELLEYFLPILRADFAIAETFTVTTSETVSIPILALGGTDDPYVNREELEGWAALTTFGCEVHFLPGGHFFLSERRAEVLSLVRQFLARR